MDSNVLAAAMVDVMHLECTGCACALQRLWRVSVSGDFRECRCYYVAMAAYVLMCQVAPHRLAGSTIRLTLTLSGVALWGRLSTRSDNEGAVLRVA